MKEILKCLGSLLQQLILPPLLLVRWCVGNCNSSILSSLLTAASRLPQIPAEQLISGVSYGANVSQQWLLFVCSLPISCCLILLILLPTVPRIYSDYFLFDTKDSSTAASQRGCKTHQGKIALVLSLSI